MPFNIFSILTCFFSLFIVPVLGQNIYSLGIEDGLSNNSVTSIYKDQYGFMWFGTLDGLNRFDGYTFKLFKNKFDDPSSLPNNRIRAIAADNTGNLWVGTEKGIGVLDNKTMQFSGISYSPDNDSQSTAKLYDKGVNDIKTGKSGNIFICSADLGLLLYKRNAKKAIQIPLISYGKKVNQYSAEEIIIDPEDNAWLMIDGGSLCFYNAKTGSLVVKAKGPLGARCIKLDPFGKLWIGTGKGLFFYNTLSHRLEKFELKDNVLNNSIIIDIYFDKNRLWLCTNGNGIRIIDIFGNSESQIVKQENLRTLTSNAIKMIYEDEQSRKWIATLRGGINVIDHNKSQFKTIAHDPVNKNSLVHNFTFSFCEDADKNVWIGTDGGGISVWNRRTNTFKNYVYTIGNDRSIGNNQVSCIVKDHEQNIWISTYGGGISKFNKHSGDFENIPFVKAKSTSVWKLHVDKGGDIWASCLVGLYRNVNRLFKYNASTHTFNPAPFPVNTDIISIADDDNENLWLGDFTGLLHANKKRGITRVFDLKAAVTALRVSKTGKLWIGTEGRGLMRYDKATNKFTTYTEDEGLSNNTVLNVEEDKKGNIWVSTFNGLSKLNPSTGKFETFYKTDGLQSNQFSSNASCQLSSGEMLFGGIKGFNIFHPDSIRQFKKFSPIMITDLRVFNLPVNAASEFVEKSSTIYNVEHIRLPYDKAMLSLDYVALEYSLPEKIQYAYYLKGWDKSWNYVNKLRTINYTRLNEGNYTLKIRSTNASGIWNPKEKTIYVTVLPPWYRSWWAYCLYLLAMGSGVYIYVYYQKEKSRLQYDLKLSALKSEQETELNEKKISFFTNIAHELRTPLTLIVNPISDLLTNKGQNINFVDVSAVHRNTNRLLSLVDQLLLFKSTDNEISGLKPEVLNLVEVCTEVSLCFNNQVKAKKINYSFQNISEKLLIFSDREKIEIVLFNLISNAIKYSDGQGSVSFVLREEDGNAVMSVKNTGRVIPAHIGDKLFEKFFRLDQVDTPSKKSGFGIGLFVSKKTAEIQGGSLSYSSNAEEGTVFVYKIPTHVESITDEAINMEKSASTPLLSELFTDTAYSRPELKQTVSENMNQVYEGVIEQRPKVLIVDDNAEMRGYINQLLKTSYTIFEAENAESALGILKKTEPDIIISDIVMPGMSGVEFCSKVKEDTEYSHIPVILLTGTSSPEVKLKGIECGADDYITKPFEKDLLIARIKSILKSRDTLKKFFFNEVTLQGNNEKVPEEYSTFLKTGIEIVERHLEDKNFNVKVFITEMKMGRTNVYRQVRAISGLTITEFIRYIRLKKAAELIIKTDIRVMEVGYAVGINDPRYFREQFSKIFGINPSEYKKKYRRTFLRAPGS